MRIEKKQIDVFRQTAEQDFVRRVAGLVREQCPHTVVGLSEEQIERQVTRQIASARRYELTWESSIGAFVLLAFQVALNFDRHPFVQQILTDAGVPPEERVDTLLRRLSPAVWDEVAEMGDEE